MLQKVFKSLNSPIKRIGFLFFIVGLLLMFLGVVDRGFYYFSYLTFVHSIRFELDSHESKLFFGIGFYASIAGVFISFLYDRTIKRIVNWVKKGSL